MPPLLVVSLAVVALVGFIDAAYLTVEHFTGAAVRCWLVSGCDAVLTSSYATVGPVPLALLGAGYYAVILGLLVAYLDSHRGVWIRLAAVLTMVGLGISLALIWLQVAIIQSLCFYCLVSAASSILLAGGGGVVLIRYRA